MEKNPETKDLKLRLNEFSDSQVVNQPTLKLLLLSPTELVNIEIPKRGLLKSRLGMKL